jgi:hypothetical protein
MAGFFDTLFGGGAEREAADKNRALYGDYQNKGEGYLKDAYTTGRADLGGALKAYDPLSALATKYGAGTDMLMNAYGLNGPQGNAAAAAAFQHNPGYEGAITAGMDILNRRRAGQGMNASGNADIDALTFGQNLENTQYGSWLQGLQGLNQNALTATGGTAQGQAGVYGGLAGLADQFGQNQTNLLGSSTSGMANANNTEAAGKAAGAKNLLGAGMSLATMALSGGTGGFGSSLAGQLFKPSPTG